jgi:hypothetical protein
MDLVSKYDGYENRKHPPEARADERYFEETDGGELSNVPWAGTKRMLPGFALPLSDLGDQAGGWVGGGHPGGALAMLLDILNPISDANDIMDAALCLATPVDDDGSIPWDRNLPPPNSVAFRSGGAPVYY